MNLAGQKRAAPGHVVLRVIEYQVNGGEVIRLLTDLLDHEAYRQQSSRPSTAKDGVRREVARCEWSCCLEVQMLKT